MCCMRFTISASYRKEVEHLLKTAQRLGHLRQVKYLLAILAVMDGQSLVVGGDILLEVEGITVATPADAGKIRDRLNQLRSGAPIKAKVLRAGQVLQLNGKVP